MFTIVSSYPAFTTSVMLIGLAGGLPLIVPGSLRLLLRAKDHKTIRGVLFTLADIAISMGRAALGTSVPKYNKGRDHTI
jgi:hypothetical protein